MAVHLQHLQVVLKEFDLVTASNKDVLICYFQKGLRASIQALIDSQNQELDFWDKVLKKAITVKAKASLQPASGI